MPASSRLPTLHSSIRAHTIPRNGDVIRNSDVIKKYNPGAQPESFRNRRREDSKWIEALLLAKEIAAVKKKIGALALQRRRAARRVSPRGAAA